MSVPVVFDQQWFDRILPIYFEPYKLFGGDKVEREREQGRFLSGQIENPSLPYPELETFVVDDRLAILVELRADILRAEKNVAVQILYRRKISELQGMLALVKAAQAGNDVAFTRYSDFVYGEFRESDVQYVLARFRQQVESALSHPDPSAREAAARLLPQIVNLPRCVSYGPLPGVLPDASPKYPGLLDSMQEVTAAFESALTNVGADDWQLVYDETGLPFFSVSQETKTVHIPGLEQLKNRQMTRAHFYGLIDHEIKTHVVRRLAGERSALRLLGLGLDRVLRAEEGVATWREQQVSGATEFAGYRLYLLLLAVRGYIGPTRDFRRTYEFLIDYYTLLKPTEAKANRETNAYHQCLRIFRGTTGTTAGAVFTKDAGYFGNRMIWALLERYPAMAEQFDIGKYDPTNDVHVTLLAQLGLFEERVLS